MNICYLLESTELCGGVRVVFDQARALEKKGHRVLIRSCRGDHRWYPHPVTVEYVSDLASPVSPQKTSPDVAIATFWTTVRAVMQLNASLKFHLCQGYEGDFQEYAPLRSEIEAVYRLPIPKITIGRWLSELLQQRFGKDSFKVFCVGQIVDIDIFRPISLWRRRLIRLKGGGEIKIIVVGLFECSFKGIPYALEAVSNIRQRGRDIYLIRVSPGAPSAGEAGITRIDEYHTHISPRDLVKIFHKSDLYLAPSLAQEGFGLPFAEALACGIPAVATAIPSYLGFDEKHDYACFVPEKNPLAMMEAAISVIDDRRLRARLGRRGPEVVHGKFRGEAVALNLESVFSGLLK
ncbi:MAG: glycosyltransferase family 4 protein [Nitrospiraceae bacterium]|nr:glycosyltransferase family 4 protein [Nitrospiraceae bacterium]